MPPVARIYDPLIKSLRHESASADSVVSCDDTISDDSSSIQLAPDLRRVILAWDGLPEALRAGILAMIDAARKDG